jgi:CheY-like chemotaxis protein
MRLRCPVSGDTLIALINDILDLVKVNSGKMSFENSPFNLLDSVATTINLFEPKTKEMNVELVANCDANIPKFVSGDALRLRQILLNLLSNAVKFTLKGKITVDISVFKDEDKFITLKFTIADTGIGISEANQLKIFNSFEQTLRETKYSHGGTGLGLAIVKQLVELQGGSISVESKEKKGSTFTIILRFGKPNLNRKLTEKFNVNRFRGSNIAKNGDKKIKVLVAEDVALNQLLIRTILTEFGLEFDIVDNGKIAIEYLTKNAYDLILMDIQMPEMGGFEATEYVRKEMKSQIPIIALTADVTTMDDEKCLKAEMNGYVSKPIDENLLFERINDALKK